MSQQAATLTQNEITKELLSIVSDIDGDLPADTAYNIREDSGCAARHSTDNIHIVGKTDGLSGLDIYVKATTQGDRVFIPACITKSNIDELVYNDFHIEDGADVTIVAGCGIHTDEDEGSKHSGIHRFFVGKNARVVYLEKHIGIGKGDGKRIIDPVTYVELEEDAYLEMETSQIGGVDHSDRKTEGKLGKNAKLIVKEHILTEGDQFATTDFKVDINGEGAGVDLISRSVAKDQSHQEFRSVIVGNERCTGHSACDAIIVGNGTVFAAPELEANHPDAMLIHEAAIGKIAGEQIVKLQTLGLTEEEAEEKIIQGFLSDH